MKELALYIVRSLVDNPDRAEVAITADGDSVRLNLQVADEDKGKVIGKQGKVIKAIRAVVGIAAAKADRQVTLDLE